VYPQESKGRSHFGIFEVRKVFFPQFSITFSCSQYSNKKEKKKAINNNNLKFQVFHLLIILAVAVMPGAMARVGGHRKLKSVNAANKRVDGQYIVMMNDNVDDVTGIVNSILRSNNGGNAKVSHNYKGVFKGVLVSNLPEQSQALRKLLDSDDVKEIYEVSRVRLSGILTCVLLI